MTIAAYRMAEQGWSAPEAMKEMQAYGFSQSASLYLSWPFVLRSQLSTALQKQFGIQ